MEWQAVVLVIQILLLTVGWILFQQARGELSARAAETPILGEVRALQRNVKQLLQDLEQTSEAATKDLEQRSDEARALITRLETLLKAVTDAQIDAHIDAHIDADYSLFTLFSFQWKRN